MKPNKNQNYYDLYLDVIKMVHKDNTGRWVIYWGDFIKAWKKNHEGDAIWKQGQTSLYGKK